MPLEILTLEKLCQMDHGRGAKAVDRAIAIVAEDLYDRDDGKERTVTIKLKFKKKKGSPDAFNVSINAGYKLPTLDTADTEAKIGHSKGKPVLKFRPESPGNADQEEIDFEVGDEEE